MLLMLDLLLQRKKPKRLKKHGTPRLLQYLLHKLTWKRLNYGKKLLQPMIPPSKKKQLMKIHLSVLLRKITKVPKRLERPPPPITPPPKSKAGTMQIVPKS